jgi:hypothetical protein
MGTGPRRLLIALGILVAVFGVSFAVLGGSRRLPASPLGSVPAEATAVASVEVGPIRRSWLYRQRVLAKGGEAGIERIARRCGFDPLDVVDRITAFASGDEPRSLDHVGFVLRGNFDPAAIAACVRDVVDAEGGRLRHVELDGRLAVAAAEGDSRAALVSDDGLAIGNEGLVRDVIAVLEGKNESLMNDPRLARLYEGVARGTHAGLVMYVPRRFRDALRRYVDDPLREAVDAVRAFGLGLALEAGIRLEARLDTTDTEAAGRLAAALDSMRSELADDPVVSLSAAGPALRAMQLDADDTACNLRLRVGRDQADDVVDLVWRRLGGAGSDESRLDESSDEAPSDGASDSRPPSPSPARALSADEVLRSGGSSAEAAATSGTSAE